jgi:LysM repeat protein
VQRGVWIVHSGDTLGSISVKTGIDVATLQTLNPDLDPQTLLEGQRIALR